MLFSDLILVRLMVLNGFEVFYDGLPCSVGHFCCCIWYLLFNGLLSVFQHINYTRIGVR